MKHTRKTAEAAAGRQAAGTDAKRWKRPSLCCHSDSLSNAAPLCEPSVYRRGSQPAI